MVLRALGSSRHHWGTLLEVRRSSRGKAMGLLLLRRLSCSRTRVFF
jgi:hypothetical protein